MPPAPELGLRAPGFHWLSRIQSFSRQLICSRPNPNSDSSLQPVDLFAALGFLKLLASQFGGPAGIGLPGAVLLLGLVDGLADGVFACSAAAAAASFALRWAS